VDADAAYDEYVEGRTNRVPVIPRPGLRGLPILKEEDTVKNTRDFFAIAAIAIGLTLPIKVVSAQGLPPGQLPELTGEWWQWALSIPASVNPNLVQTGDDTRMIGQRGPLYRAQPCELCDRDGSLIPFARTRTEREAAGDPRPSLEERYGSRDIYVARVEAAAAALVADRLLLPADAAAYVKAARETDRF